MLRKIPTFWLIVLGIMLTSAITLGLMATSVIQTTRLTVEDEQIRHLQLRAEVYSLYINERLKAFENETKLVATQAKLSLLNNNISAEEIQSRLEKYQRDTKNVYGLDNWFNTNYRPKYGNDHISNVFINKDTKLTAQLERAIAATEDLNDLFMSVHNSNLGSQWIYLTLPSGVMRLYPYTASSSYPDGWEPQAQPFYTVADKTHNPEHKTTWTTPYNDFSGAGLMVTNSLPIYDGETLLGVMSNDFVIKDIQNGILGFQVGTNGYAFLLDNQGNIIVHKNYAPENTPKGKEINIKLAEQAPYLDKTIEEILNGRIGKQIVTDTDNKEWVIVYAPIPATNWHLCLMQPLAEIVQPATDIANQVKIGALILVLLALVASLITARWISLPVIRLSKKARFISETVDAMDISIEKRSDTEQKENNDSKMSSTREIYELEIMFDEMVNTLQKRINELGSIYTLGQTIGATVEYEKSLNTVLSAVKRTIKSDFAGIYILQNSHWNLEISSQLSENGSPSMQKLPPMPESLMAEILEQKTSLLINSPTQEYQNTKNTEAIVYFKEKQVHSLLVVPLMTDEKSLGLVSLENYGIEHFTEDNQRQLNRLAALASIAINNAIQVRQREQVLKEQISELKIEIDQSKMKKEVSQIVETDYFQSLQKRASEIRARATRKDEL